MPAPLINFPASAVVDCLLSYLQWVFGNPEITPAEYRWNVDNRASKIRICAPFVIDNEKPMSAPFIVVERGPLSFANRTLDNVKRADPNTMENMEKVDWMDGFINVICGSGVAGEASSIANFLAIMLQADRHGIIDKSRFIRNLNYIDMSPEVPVVKDTEVRRWEVTLRLSISLQIGWVNAIMEPVLWTKAAVYEAHEPPVVFSDAGIISEGESTLFDSTKDFGHLISNNPQLLQQEFARGWYYIRFKNNVNLQLYTIIEIVNNHTLKLQTHDEDNNPVLWISTETATDVEYDLLWNTMHIHMELPAGA